MKDMNMCNQMVVTCLAEKRSQHAYQNPVGSILYHSLLKVCVWVTVSWHTVQRSLGGDYVTIHTHIKIIPRYLKYYLMVLADLLQLKLARKQKTKSETLRQVFHFLNYLSYHVCRKNNYIWPVLCQSTGHCRIQQGKHRNSSLLVY